MPTFDPTVPVNGTEADADPIRSNFVQLSVHHVGATEPGNKTQGYVWLDTANASNHILKIYDASAWRVLFENAGSIPAAIAVAHAVAHQNGGADELSVVGLSGLLATAQTPIGHSALHEDGGADEISVAGLTGLLGTDQNPVAHAADHEDGGADEISVAGLTGLLSTDQNPVAHAADHGNGGTDAVSIEALATAGGAGTVPVSQGDGSVAMELVGGGGESYVDRGNPATFDFDETNLTMNNAWHDLNLSGIVGAAARLVHLRIVIFDGAARILSLRTKGNSNAYNVAEVQGISGDTLSVDLWVYTDSAGKVEYRVTATASYILITVGGWFA